MCDDDTFIERELEGRGFAEENQENRFSTMEGTKIERLLCFFLAVKTFLSLIIVLKVTLFSKNRHVEEFLIK